LLRLAALALDIHGANETPSTFRWSDTQLSSSFRSFSNKETSVENDGTEQQIIIVQRVRINDGITPGTIQGRISNSFGNNFNKILITKGGRKQRLWIGICIEKKIFVVGKNGWPGSALGVIRLGSGDGDGHYIYVYREPGVFGGECMPTICDGCLIQF
jgi:hypothetical protein